MSTVALQEVWQGLLAYNLTAANKRWLAERLLQEAGEETKLQPYTMEELNERLDRAEADIAVGRVYTLEESRRLRREHLAKLMSL